MSTYSPVNLNPRRDADALLVLLLSLLLMALTLGLFYLLLFIHVLYRAKTTASCCQSGTATALVFGKRLTDDKPDREYRCRLDRLLASTWQRAVLMGGITAQANISEAQAGYQYLLEKGLRNKNVHLEQSSRNTLENLKNTRQFLQSRQTVIISNRYHLARCALLVSSLGMSCRLCAAEDRFHANPANLCKCLKEAFYLHWFLCGKYWAKLTRNRRMLDKIS